MNKKKSIVWSRYLKRLFCGICCFRISTCEVSQLENCACKGRYHFIIQVIRITKYSSDYKSIAANTVTTHTRGSVRWRLGLRKAMNFIVFRQLKLKKSKGVVKGSNFTPKARINFFLFFKL